MEDFANKFEITFRKNDENIEILINIFGKYYNGNLLIILKNNELEEIKSKIEFSNFYLEKEDIAFLHYKKKDFINFGINSKQTNLFFKSKLNQKNYLYFADFFSKSKILNGRIKFENNKIIGKLNSEKYSIDLDINITLKKDIIPKSGFFKIKYGNIESNFLGENYNFKGKTKINNFGGIESKLNFGKNFLKIKNNFNFGNIKGFFTLNSDENESNIKIEIKKLEEMIFSIDLKNEKLKNIEDKNTLNEENSINVNFLIEEFYKYYYEFYS